MAWQGGWQGEESTWSGSRRYVGQERAVGVLVDWQQRAGNSFGWITPLYGIPDNLPESIYHGGDIYVHWKDIQDPRPGAVVTFRAYVDKQGLGAENCSGRPVLRFVVPKDSPKALTLPFKESNSCAKYLTSSTFYPELEERGVTLRKYLWDSPLQVYEMWGQPEDMMTAAEEIGLLSHPHAEALVSLKMVQHEPRENIREVPADDLPNVPPAFRAALLLGGGDGVRDRLLQILHTEPLLKSETPAR
eukprot:CAMPEP_0117506558 /NCGR_PEP_ID=MMETSP0784-20121206/25969_1 /TAXON_ID=39447 /ORGANISM="" /LENGTH=245 /DNA_ID=CAMNT_0005302033 /DNA_START=77 /DNA_END=812 /DNA_ORIENTATION=-